jgi:hypothetical protein
LSVPSVWPFVLVALAAFRTWRVIAEDTILDRPRARFVGWLPKGEEFVTCPWCAGFWVSLAWWGAWEAWPHWTLIVAAPFAISAVVGLIAANIDPA